MSGKMPVSWGGTGILRIYLSGRNTGGRNPAPFHTSGTAPCDRDIIFRENGNPGDHTGGMFEYLQVFLQSDVSAGSNLWTFE